VGIGSETGSKIVVEEEGVEAFLRDRANREVVSSLDAGGLRKIAQATNGLYVATGDGGSSLVELYDKHILPSTRQSFETKVSNERQNRFQWPLFAAFLLWLLEIWWTDRRRA
jgi:hypothetical protein